MKSLEHIAEHMLKNDIDYHVFTGPDGAEKTGVLVACDDGVWITVFDDATCRDSKIYCVLANNQLEQYMMTKEQIESIFNSAPIAFMAIMRDHECSRAEAALILRDTMELHDELHDAADEDEFVSVSGFEAAVCGMLQ